MVCGFQLRPSSLSDYLCCILQAHLVSLNGCVNQSLLTLSIGLSIPLSVYLFQLGFLLL